MPNNPADHGQHTAYSETSETSAPADAAVPRRASDSVGLDTPRTPAKRGFAAMDETMQRTIASKGGQSQGKANNPGNFANNRERARAAGRKGGEAHGHRAHRPHAEHPTHP